MEIQRLIGRALRRVVDTQKMGERTITVDCDAIQADGGTRTAAITGAYVAVYDAMRWMVDQRMMRSIALREGLAAISVGIVDGEERLDLEYVEDRDAEVDLNLVMTGSGKFIEVQGSGEEATFARKQLDKLIDLGESGIAAITKEQKKTLGSGWPW